MLLFCLRNVEKKRVCMLHFKVLRGKSCHQQTKSSDKGFNFLVRSLRMNVCTGSEDASLLTEELERLGRGGNLSSVEESPIYLRGNIGMTEYRI